MFEVQRYLQNSIGRDSEVKGYFSFLWLLQLRDYSASDRRVNN